MGSPPTTRCPRCGTENAPTMRFCGNCGADLYPQAAGGTPGGGPTAPQPRGFPVWGIVAIVGGVVAVAAVVTILVLTQDSEPVETATPPQQQETVDPALDQLGAFLPPEVVNCEEGATIEFEGWIAAATCDPASGDPVVIQFFLYESPEAARTAYDGRLASAGLPSDVGDCSIGEAGEMGWSGDGGQGRLLCGTNDAGHVALEWTSDAFPIVGSMFATTTDLTVQDIYTVWQGISDYTSA